MVHCRAALLRAHVHAACGRGPHALRKTLKSLRGCREPVRHRRNTPSTRARRLVACGRGSPVLGGPPARPVQRLLGGLGIAGTRPHFRRDTAIPTSLRHRRMTKRFEAFLLDGSKPPWFGLWAPTTTAWSSAATVERRSGHSTDERTRGKSEPYDRPRFEAGISTLHRQVTPTPSCCTCRLPG